MRIILTSNVAPFLSGGAELHAQHLLQALQQAGHQVEHLRFPFVFNPESAIEQLMRHCAGLDLRRPNGQSVDQVISLQFPGYGVQHDRHVAWVMHQHRAVYDLYQASTASPALQRLRQAIEGFDRQHLGAAQAVWANSRNVADRLWRFNQVRALPLYHPPPQAEQLQCAEPWGYFFFPSRFESLKRQHLVIEAAALCRQPVRLLLAGTGGQLARCQGLIDQWHLTDRVRLMGQISRAQLLTLYAHANAVVYPPFDEDLGYVTLEAMYAGKPVLTCSDAGGPLEFVQHGHTGWVVEPTAAALAEAMDQLWAEPTRCAEMGRNGRGHIEAMDLSWPRVVEQLCT